MFCYYIFINYILIFIHSIKPNFILLPVSVTSDQVLIFQRSIKIFKRLKLWRNTVGKNRFYEI